MPERAVIRNPILPGFNPDPSIVRVGDDYYIATSTFEWFPGVQIHHSRDLVHWRLLTRPLTRARASSTCSAIPDSCGVWAPCLTPRRRPLLPHLHRREALRPHHGRRRLRAPRCATSTTTWSPARASTATGPIRSTSTAAASIRRCSTTTTAGSTWSTCSGTTGPGRNRFAGIVLQEYSPAERRLVGERRVIFEGTPLGLTEAPHLYKRDGYYYLLTAEGGTGWGHAVTMARVARADRALRAAPRRLHPERARTGPTPRCSAPAMPTSSRRRPARPTWSISAAGRSGTAAAARSAARPRSSRCSGATTAGCGRRTATGLPAARGPGRRTLPRIRSRRPPAARRLRRRHAADRLPVAALAVAGRALQPDARGPGTCASTAARRSAACSARPWSRGASRRTASAPRR